MVHFTSIPSIRFLSYEKHPPPINDFSQLDSLNRNGQPTTNPTTQAISQFQRSAPFSESTHKKSYEHPITSTEIKKPEPLFQKIFPDHSNQKQAPTKPFATSRYNKQNNKSSRYNHTNSHYVKKNFAQQPSSKIEIRSTPTPPKATQNSAFQEEMTPSNFPTLPSQKTASEHQEESRQPEDPFETTQRMIRELFNQLNH